MKKKKRPASPPPSKTKTKKPDRQPHPKRISPATEDAETTFPLNEWMIPATDAHGHSAKVFTRVPPSYKHTINVILQKKKYPWETESDMVRVAVHRLLEAIAKDSTDPEILSQQAILNSMAEASSRQLEYLHFKETLEKVSVTVAEMIRVEAYPVARKIIRNMAEQVEKFEDEYWRTRFRAELINKYGDMLKEKR